MREMPYDDFGLADFDQMSGELGGDTSDSGVIPFWITRVTRLGAKYTRFG